MRTSRLDRIMRQKDPDLLRAVEHLAKNETATGIRMLAEQGRVTEHANAKERIEAIARDYAAHPDNTIIVSPDNRGRQLINQAVRMEMKANGTLANEGQELQTLVHRSDMTGADRSWAARYQPGDVLQYTAGSQVQGIKRGSVATVLAVDAQENDITVSLEDGRTVTYDPRRLKGVNAYQEAAREFATGDRLQFTSGDKKLGVASRDLDDDIVDVFAQRITTPFNVYKNVFIPNGEYNWTRHQLTYGSPQDRRLMLNFYERFGSYYNGRLNEFNVRATYRANAKLSFSFSEQWNRFRLPVPGGNFSVLFGGLQTNYSFSRFLTLSGLVQMNTANTQAVSGNFRLRWNYRPDSDLYVIYTAGQRFASETASNPPQFYENSLVVKYTYSWRP
jgi:hypothetical protein